MIDVTDDAVLENVRTILDRIKVMKILKLKGFQVNDTNFSIDTDCMYTNSYDFGEAHFSNSIFEDVEVTIGNSEGSELADYYSEDECTIYHASIKHHSVMEYYKYCKENNINLCQRKLVSYIKDAIRPMVDHASDYTYYDFYIPVDLSLGLVVLFTDYEFFTSNFIENYFDIIEFCEKFVRGEIEVDKPIEG